MASRIQTTTPSQPAAQPAHEQAKTTQSPSAPVGSALKVFDAHNILHLQRAIGNHATSKLLSPSKSSPTPQAGVIQLERFIGKPARHHLHVDIGQEHYKLGNDRGSRIELGQFGNYKLDQLIVARNHLEDLPGGKSDGRDECFEWLTSACEEHDDWDEAAGFVPSWEQEEEEANPHVDGLFEKASEYGFSRANFENTFIQAKTETTAEVLGKLNEYTKDTTKEEIESTIEKVTLRDVLVIWSGFGDDVYDKEVIASNFNTAVRDYIRNLLFDKFPLYSNKSIESFSGAAVDDEDD